MPKKMTSLKKLINLNPLIEKITDRMLIFDNATVGCWTAHEKFVTSEPGRGP